MAYRPCTEGRGLPAGTCTAGRAVTAPRPAARQVALRPARERRSLDTAVPMCLGQHFSFPCYAKENNKEGMGGEEDQQQGLPEPLESRQT